MSATDGGPAFPRPNVRYGMNLGLSEDRGQPGMTLRDYFAGQALAAVPNRSWEGIVGDKEMPEAWARLAYACADAMLAERDK